MILLERFGSSVAIIFNKPTPPSKIAGLQWRYSIITSRLNGPTAARILSKSS
jgi:hypothetical protein